MTTKHGLKHIQTISPYIAGKPIEEIQRELGLAKISKLASNENAFGCSEQVKNILRDLDNEYISRYPDSECYYLKRAICNYLNSQNLSAVRPSQLLIGNGSNEVLELIARCFAKEGDEIIYSEFGFIVYELSAQAINAVPVKVAEKNYHCNLGAILKAITKQTKIIFLANPNNPTGTAFTASQWQDFISKVPEHIIVVLDEAYIHYVDPSFEYPRGLNYINKYPNLILSQTFSKAFGLSGLRVGYMIASSQIVEFINRIREPFNVNTIAQKAAIAALTDLDFVRKSVEANAFQKKILLRFYEDYNIEYLPSQTNFVVIKAFARLDAMAIYQKLLKLGVIVRPLANYNMKDFLRVSVGTELENNHFMESAKKIINKNN